MLARRAPGWGVSGLRTAGCSFRPAHGAVSPTRPRGPRWRVGLTAPCARRKSRSSAAARIDPRRFAAWPFAFPWVPDRHLGLGGARRPSRRTKLLDGLNQLVRAYCPPAFTRPQIPRNPPGLLLTFFSPIFTILLTWLFRKRQPGPPRRGASGRIRRGIPFSTSSATRCPAVVPPRRGGRPASPYGVRNPVQFGFRVRFAETAPGAETH
jgi:hypothetical protein